MDFAGCTAVHMVGGISGTIGAYILGQRYGFKMINRIGTRVKIGNIPGY